ncbi:MAG: protein phosphatase 2C family protein [Eubacterium sp.]|nr:protein phosphatase 2C family protein [Eubacterium sp.]MDD7210104.1 PP2C family serine/threonine-protein phosphatase [Lachnospiraceae bacterium]MDY5496522.1 PP2C family serine/threonine-protein phosphatase [Anaerobutyricum sp.]
MQQTEWKVKQLCIRGKIHENDSKDHCAMVQKEDVTVMTLCEGGEEALYSGVGAESVAQFSAEYFADCFEKLWEAQEDEYKLGDLLLKYHQQMMVRLAEDAFRKTSIKIIADHKLKKSELDKLSTSLQVCAVCGNRLIYIKIGNGMAVQSFSEECKLFSTSKRISELSVTVPKAEDLVQKAEVKMTILPEDCQAFTLLTSGMEYTTGLYGKGEILPELQSFLSEFSKVEEEKKDALLDKFVQSLQGSKAEYMQGDLGVSILYRSAENEEGLLPTGKKAGKNGKRKKNSFKEKMLELITLPEEEDLPMDGAENETEGTEKVPEEIMDKEEQEAQTFTGEVSGTEVLEHSDEPEKEVPEAEIDKAVAAVKRKVHEAAEHEKLSGADWKKWVPGILCVTLLVVVIVLGMKVNTLQKENRKLKAQIEKQEAKEAQETEEDLFSYIKIDGKEYQLLGSLSDFTKEGWKLKALRTENATLVPGGKLEKDAYLTNKSGVKVGVIIRNLGDADQKVSSCSVTKLSFSKKESEDKVILPNKLGFKSSSRTFKKYGFKKDGENTLKYENPDVQGEYIKVTLDQGGRVTGIVLEKEEK